MTKESPVPTHTPVLLSAVMEQLAPASDRTIVDCTLGLGGHSAALAPRLLPSGRLIAIDRDAQALDLARRRLVEFLPQIRFVHDDFANLRSILDDLGIDRVNGVVADLGVSSLHLDAPDRGFSFLREGPLDMRMDQDAHEETAADVIRRLSESELVYVIETYGEERWARRIARAIVQARRTQPILTTTQLARVIVEAVPSSAGPWRLHPATRTFQALRIVVNHELASVQALLAALPGVLAPGGRAVLISFHSLEDRLVKEAFASGAASGVYRLLTRKVVRPTDQEVDDNPRARSARLRAVERLAA